jgi:hypothetical protein
VADKEEREQGTEQSFVRPPAQKDEREQTTEERQESKEFLDRCFEFLKHMSTLGTAAALLLLAIFRERPFEFFLLTAAVSLLGLCVVLSVWGMLLISVSFFAQHEHDARTRETAWSVTWWSGLLFVMAGVLLAIYLTGGRLWVRFIDTYPRAATVLALLILLVAVYFVYRRVYVPYKHWSRTTPPPEPDVERLRDADETDARRD